MRRGGCGEYCEVAGAFAAHRLIMSSAVCLMGRAMTTLDYIALATLVALLVFAVVIGSQMGKSKR